MAGQVWTGGVRACLLFALVVYPVDGTSLSRRYGRGDVGMLPLPRMPALRGIVVFFSLGTR